ncbi:MAG: T9SS type A sorting domain-containing protein [Ignavibacteria bacterium]
MRRLIIVFLFMLSPYLITAQWVKTNGPYGGTVNCLITNGANIFAGIQRGGVFLSTNNGSSWSAVNNGLTNLYINSLAVSGTNLYAGTNNGVFLSSNNGTSWSSIGLMNKMITSIIVSGTNLFVGTFYSDYAVFSSTNNGTSWTPLGLTSENVSSLAVSGTNLFAGTSGGVFLSTNNGTSWTQTNGVQINSLVVLGTNLFAATWSGGGVLLSTNNGTSWTSVNNGLIYKQEINTLIRSGTKLFAGTDKGTFLSINNGTSWTSLGLTNQNVWSLSILGTNIFAGYGEGLSLSTNNGTNWSAINNGLTSQEVWTLTFSGTNIFAGTGVGGVFLSTNNGSNWTSVNEGLTNRWVPALFFLGKNIFAGTGGGVFLSTNNGVSWISVNNGLTNDVARTFIVSGTNLFAGTDGGVFLSTNNGASWTATGLVGINALAVSGTNLFAGATGGQIFLSTNNGTSWTTVVDMSNNVLCLAVSGTNLYAGTGDYPVGSGGVFLSTNNGSNWTGVNNGLTNRGVNTLVVFGSNLLAGTYGGVFLSTNNGTNWINKNQGFNVDPVVGTMLIANNYLYAGTYGNSVWKRPLSEIIPLLAPSNLMYDKINNQLAWSLSPSSNVANYLIYKKGSDNVWKSVADSGGLLNSNANFYNLQISGYNYYRVAAISNSGDTARCDSIYVNRGYVLRRWNTGIIESFKVKKNGFRFGNSESSNGEPILWNSSWYSQFHYFYPPYPITFSLFNSSDYPDWPLFTNVYGRNKCYSYYLKPGNILDSSFLRKSVKKWRDIIYNPAASRWRGACMGMAASSLLAFYKNALFYNQFPIINNVENIYDLSPSSGISKIVNWLHQTQYFGGTAGRYSLPVDLAGQTPVIVLNNLESRFSKTTTPGKLNEILAIFNESGGGHAVVPYAIEKINDSIKHLYIYDNEYPGIDTARFIINTISNSCINNMNNRRINRIYLMGSLESFLGEQTFENNIQKSYSNKKTSNDSILFFNSINSSIYYLNQNGDTISGFRITDSSIVGNKNLGFSPMTNGRVNPPVYYKLPYTNYLKVILKDFDPSVQTSFLSFDIDSTTSYKIERTDPVQSNQNDIYLIDNDYFSFVNSNPVQKRINLLTIITENLQSKKEKTFDISKFVTIQNDTVFMKKNNDNLVLKSTGSSKIYTLKLNYIDSSGNKSFYNPSVFLPQNSTHIISPIWDSIKTKPVKIYVDLGNNGTIDDTVFISDTVLTKINNTNIEIPGNYKLYQNYPNPFNPSTKIKYDIKIDGLVTLKVYNILGSEVASLVSEVKQAGRYEVEFNGSNLGSGVYYYRLQAGDFSETKRMLLLK